MWLTPVKLPPLVPVVSHRECIGPRKLGFSNTEILLVGSQIIVVKVEIALFASRVVPHTYFRLLALRLQLVQFGTRECLWLSAADQQQRQDENEFTQNAEDSRAGPIATKNGRGVRPAPTGTTGYAWVIPIKSGIRRSVWAQMSESMP